MSAPSGDSRVAARNAALDEQLVLQRELRVTHELPDTDETVLFDDHSSELLVLSDTAAAIWYLIDGQRSVGEIVRFIEAEAPASPANLRDVVLEFLGELLRRGAAVPTGGLLGCGQTEDDAPAS